MMVKFRLYFRFSYGIFLWVFGLVTLPFIALKLMSFPLKELPFMFIAILGLIKFYLSKAQTGAALRHKVKAILGHSASNQSVVDNVRAYRSAQDIVLLLNAILILVFNIFL